MDRTLNNFQEDVRPQASCIALANYLLATSYGLHPGPHLLLAVND